MIIKSNEDLFNEWKDLPFRISCLAHIVQNDMEITERDFREWRRISLGLLREMERLRDRTKAYIRELNP